MLDTKLKFELLDNCDKSQLYIRNAKCKFNFVFNSYFILPKVKVKTLPNELTFCLVCSVGQGNRNVLAVSKMTLLLMRSMAHELRIGLRFSVLVSHLCMQIYAYIH